MASSRFCARIETNLSLVNRSPYFLGRRFVRVGKRGGWSFPSPAVNSYEKAFGGNIFGGRDNLYEEQIGGTPCISSGEVAATQIKEDSHSPNEDVQGKECPSQMKSPSEGDNQTTGKKRKSTSKTSTIKDTFAENNKMIISTLQMAEEGRMKRHEMDCVLIEERHKKDCVLIEQRMQKEELNEERLIKIEEQKINVQLNLVSALTSIGQAMMKISDSF
ncbi:hypothetical protein KI387_005800 [Taxus chinensis]|uniref:Uncharacterized protein n=1 Tax=Taxus chinensis TaxID=29808 RepID=A0AA38GP43_TAXCH|nr:hypothetical protein KI387_005800 [Taxus chinensis]